MNDAGVDDGAGFSNSEHTNASAQSHSGHHSQANAGFGNSAAELSQHIQAWRNAAQDPRVGALMRELESQAQEQLHIHRPVCLASGKCCNFEQHGHSMWLTGLEVAWTLSQLPSAPTSSEVAASVRQGNCPFLVQGMCGIHQARPLGCRAYFCDQAGQGWQEAMMESWLGRIRSLHVELEIAYRYDEWRRLLGAFSQHEQVIPAGTP